MSSEDKRRATRPEGGRTANGTAPTSCEAIQAVLFDYLARELGSARSDLVREHLRKCPECRGAAAEMQNTVDLLHAASRDDRDMPTTLSDARRRRLRRAVLHPVLDWIDRHHVVASLVVAVVSLVVLLLFLRHVRAGRGDLPEAGPTIFYGGVLAPGEDPDESRLQPPEERGEAP